MFNMRNVVITYLYDFIKNFSKDGISKILNEHVSTLTHQINSVCERLAEAKELPHTCPVHFLTGLTRCIVPEFLGHF